MKNRTIASTHRLTARDSNSLSGTISGGRSSCVSRSAICGSVDIPMPRLLINLAVHGHRNSGHTLLVMPQNISQRTNAFPISRPFSISKLRLTVSVTP
jgi:hypothetical protein